MDDDLSSESMEIPEMPEQNKTLTQIVSGIAATLVIAAIIACAGGYVATNTHLAKIDTVLEQQTKILDTLPTKLDGMATTPVVEHALSELRERMNDQQKQLNACREEKAGIERTSLEMRSGLQKQIDTLNALITARTASRWSALEMDHWISLAKDKLGKPLPTVSDVTGHSPLYDPQSAPAAP